MTRRLKPCCCCSQEQMSCDLQWPCKISLGIWTDFNRLFIENFWGKKNLNEMFFFSRCSWESGASSERPWQLCCEHIHSQSDGEHIHTHTPFFPAVLLPVVSMATEAQLLSAVDQLTGTIYSQNTGITDRREVFKVMSRRMLTCSFLSFMTKNTWMCLNLKYSSLSGVKCSQ